MKRKWIKSLLVLLALGAGAVAWHLRAGDGASTPVFEPVRFARQNLMKTIEATAVVEPRNRIEIKPPIGGRIDEVLVAEGQEVEKGEVVARMSSTERATLLDAARARGPEMLLKWEDAYKATSLIAPLAGTIISRDTEPGQTVTAQDSVLVLSDRLIVSSQVDETDIGSVKVGQRVRIGLDAYPDVELAGAVSRVAFEATTINNVTIYEVEVEPGSIPDCMKSGMTATVEFILAEAEQALTLPAGALDTEAGETFVWVQPSEPGAHPERQKVLTGITSGGRVEILEGLQGDEVVVQKGFALQKSHGDVSSPFVQAPPGRPR